MQFTQFYCDNMKKPAVLILTVLAIIRNCSANSLTLCPGNATSPLADQKYTIDGFPFHVTTEEVRLPESGEFQKVISCLFIIDTSATESGGTPVIKEGGVGYPYVEIKLTSKMGGNLEYRIQAYSATKTQRNIMIE